MKNSKLLLFLFSMLSISVYYGCKKEDPAPEPRVIVPTVAPDNTICDGNLKNTFCPLDSATAWAYTYKIAGVVQSITPYISVTDSATYGSYSFAMLVDVSSLVDTMVTYLREDTTSHDIISYNVGAAQEYLEVPNAPTIGQSWTIPGSLYKKVTNLSADLHTASCWYTNLLEISVFSGNTIVYKYYYKRGFGLVCKKDMLNDKNYSVSSVHFR